MLHLPPCDGVWGLAEGVLVFWGFVIPLPGWAMLDDDSPVEDPVSTPKGDSGSQGPHKIRGHPLAPRGISTAFLFPNRR